MWTVSAILFSLSLGFYAVYAHDYLCLIGSLANAFAAGGLFVCYRDSMPGI